MFGILDKGGRNLAPSPYSRELWGSKNRRKYHEESMNVSMVSVSRLEERFSLGKTQLYIKEI